MKTLQVIRTHTSPYQAGDFKDQEKKLIEGLGLHYRTPEDFDPAAEVVLITNTHTQLRSLNPHLLTRTKLILHPNSGYDHFREEHDLWKDIPLVVGHRIRAQAVAEYSLSCLFQGISELPQHLSWDSSRTWNRRLVGNLSVWVFGYGHIGRLIADTLHALGARVTVVDPFVRSPYAHHDFYQNGLIGEADVVIAACSLNPTSEKLFDQEFFKAIKADLLFINGARGKLVDASALRTFLASHPQAFAFLDVFDQEPFGPEWHHHPQIWKTSHIAGVHTALDHDILAFEREALTQFLTLPLREFLAGFQAELLQNKWRQGVLI